MSTRRHLIYIDLLFKCLVLEEWDARKIAKRYGMPDEANRTFKIDDRVYSSLNHSELHFIGLRSCPSFTLNLLACDHLAERHDLEDTPGFYFSRKWRLNLPERGIVKPYHDETNRIIGLFVYQFISDMRPRLLSSKGLTRGVEAVQPLPTTQREVA